MTDSSVEQRVSDKVKLSIGKLTDSVRYVSTWINTRVYGSGQIVSYVGTSTAINIMVCCSGQIVSDKVVVVIYQVWTDSVR